LQLRTSTLFLEKKLWLQEVIKFPDFAAQKLEYIHYNQVEEGIVEKAEEYIYSSARDYYYGSNVDYLIEFLI